MRRLLSLGILLSVFIVAIGCNRAGNLNDTNKQQIISYVKLKLNIPDFVQLEIKNIRNSEVNGLLYFDLVQAQGGNWQQTFLISKNLRHVLLPGEGQVDLIDVTKDPRKEVMKAIALTNQHVKGNPKAELTVIEYSDFQCPYCKRHNDQSMKSIHDNYGDKVKIIFKHFPLSFHDWAEDAALASECAALQKPDSFWSFHDFYFQEQKAITKETVVQQSTKIAQQEGLNTTRFKECVAKKETLAKVQEDMKEGQKVGVRGTPLTVINGRVISGALPFEHVKSIIDSELNRLQAAN